MGDTAISWTDKTWNPIRGCSRVSEGCRNCYAERVAARFSGPGKAYEGLAEMRKSQFVDDRGREAGLPRWTGEVRVVPEHLADPLRWRGKLKIFVNSMSDLFHESLTNEQIAAVFGVMAACPQHTFQVLTKRAMRMRDWFTWMLAQPRHEWATARRHAAQMIGSEERIDPGDALPPENGHRHWPAALKVWPLPNVWLGVSVENQAAADERIPELCETPAAVRFLSCEPLLGPIDITEYMERDGGRCGEDHETIDWVIAGCESGPGARPCEVEWLRSIRDQCAAAGVPFFLKQAREVITYDGNPDGETDDVVIAGKGSKAKAGGVIELPYLDGEQHAAFPEVSR